MQCCSDGSDGDGDVGKASSSKDLPVMKELILLNARKLYQRRNSIPFISDH